MGRVKQGDARVDQRTRQQGGKGETVAGFLAEAIRSGRFVPGQRLVETDLTAELGVSRGPVREAFRRLSAEGLLEIVPNRGALVRRLGRDEALQLFEIRVELEALAARKAAANMGDDGLRADFTAAVAPIFDAAPRRSAQAYIAENTRFHGAVVAASGNCALVRLAEQMQLSLILAQVAEAIDAATIAASVAEHRQIAEAILDRDRPAAEAAMRAHLHRASAFLAEVPQELFRDPA